MNIRFLAVVAGIALGVASYQLVEGTGKHTISLLHFIIKNPHLSYDEKMRVQRGGWINLGEFVKKNTPLTAVIVYPRFGATFWEYFLYPRKLLLGSQKWPAVHKSATHVLVARGWPRFPLNTRKFLHLYLSPTRKILVDKLGVGSSLPGISSKFSQENAKRPSQLLGNYISDAEKKVEHHQRTKVGNHLVELIQVNYTFTNYDYWMKTVDFPLTERTVVKVEIKVNIKHIVNLVAEIRYDNDKLAIFGSLPNKKVETWEVLSITDLYQMAKEYALARGWSIEKMRITRIGVNTGCPQQMPYQEGYGVIELERGQPGIKENTDPKIDNAPYFFKMANYYKAKNQFKKATKYYQLAGKLNPADAWIHSGLGDIHVKMGDDTRAVEKYKKAIQLEPDIAWFYFTLGRVYQKEGKINLARKSYEKALRVDPSGIWADDALKNLDQGKK
ncbi:hypothetical protein ES703_70507 [subsurface metagenome]